MQALSCGGLQLTEHYFVLFRINLYAFECSELEFYTKKKKNKK